MTPLELAMTWLRGGQLGGDPLPDTPETARRARELQLLSVANPGALETILQMTLFRPAVDYTLPKDGTFESYALVREGQNTVAIALLKYIDHADQLDRRPGDAHSIHGADHAGAGRRRSSDDDFGGDDFHVG